MGKCKAKAIKTDDRHNQAYSGIFRIMCNPGVFRTVVYPEPWYIQNQKHIQNPGMFTYLVYSETRYIIQNAGIFKIRDTFRILS